VNVIVIIFRRCDAMKPEAMLIYSMSVSVDGSIADRAGAFGWTVPSEEQFRFHTAQTRQLGGYLCGRRLYETMLVWETDPSMRDNELGWERRFGYGRWARNCGCARRPLPRRCCDDRAVRVGS
jgi:dihydrofolate reductase